MFAALTEHQVETQTLARSIAERLRETVVAADRAGRPAEGVAAELASAGLLGLCLPRRYGGLGADYLALGLACEELEAVDATLRVVLSVHLALHALGIFQWGTESQRERWLPALARGERLGMFGLTDAGAGSDPANLDSTAQKVADGYVLNGLKRWISLAGQADQILWIARTDATAPANEGLSAFILDTRTHGVSTGPIEGKVGLRAMHTGWVRCQDVHVPGTDRLGDEGEGFKIAMACLDNGRYTVGAGAAGTIRAALRLSKAYAQQRETFGRPLATRQLIQQKVAHMARDYELTRLLYLQAGWLKNRGQRNTRETSLLKWQATDTAFAAADSALQILGAEGYSDAQPIERIWRNARVGAIYEGTNEIHQLIQAGYALGDRRDALLRCELPAYDAQAWS
ncbi:MAG: acyl-CoA dehydrogenase family protein [Anaerolineales bacterium]|nr:acyl-CoA dehydrogenase family protein [Anaerolineales bacterium]